MTKPAAAPLSFSVDLSEVAVLIRSPWGKFMARIRGRLSPDAQGLLRSLERPSIASGVKSQFVVSKRKAAPRVLQIFGDDIRAQLCFEQDIPFKLESAIRDVMETKRPPGTAMTKLSLSGVLARQKRREAELSASIAEATRARLATVDQAGATDKEA